MEKLIQYIQHKAMKLKNAGELGLKVMGASVIIGHEKS